MLQPAKILERVNIYSCRSSTTTRHISFHLYDTNADHEKLIVHLTERWQHNVGDPSTVH
jgi:hypothetical protein